MIPSKISRRQFLKRTAAALLAMGIYDCSFVKAEAARNAANLRQIITSDPAHSRVIMWETRYYPSNPRVEFFQNYGVNEEAEATVQQLFDGSGYVITACLENLQPGKRYFYRAVTDNSRSELFTLNTPNDSSFSALIFSDSQCSSRYGTWENVFSSAFSQFPECNLYTVIGDLVDNGADRLHWSRWMNAQDGLREDKLFVPVIGNHECYTSSWSFGTPDGYLQRFQLPGNGSGEWDGYYYSFDYGPVHFMVLCTVAYELDGVKPGSYQAQQEWLQADAAKTSKPWKIVLMHRDVVSYGYEFSDYENDFTNEGNAFMNIFEETGVDLVLMGHIHSYRNHGHIYMLKPSDYGPYYINCGLSGDQHYSSLPPIPKLDLVLAPQPDVDDFLVLNATDKELQLDCYQTDGTPIDSIQLSQQAKKDALAEQAKQSKKNKKKKKKKDKK